jgi:hypothetical protein
VVKGRSKARTSGEVKTAEVQHKKEGKWYLSVDANRKAYLQIGTNAKFDENS